MICVSIGRGSAEMMAAEHKQMVEQGAELVELRLDYLKGKYELRTLLENRPGPVVATCRRKDDGGRFGGSEEDRLLVLRKAIAEGADYIDLEDDVAGSIPRFGSTKRIVSLHNFRRTPDDLDEIHARLRGLDADIVKIATFASGPRDNLKILEMVDRCGPQVPTVGLCMGDIGIPSRILSARHGVPFTYATFHHERQLAPGQLTFREMKEMYRYDSIDRETQVYGVIGDPIGHSYSPLVHNAAYQRLGLNAVYMPCRVPFFNLKQFLEDAPKLGFRALSVTIPHKEAVLEQVTAADDVVTGAGAANTLLFTPDGIKAYNTDVPAAMASIDTVLAQPNQGDALNGAAVLILGAGGAARGIAYGLLQRGADVTITGRTEERANELAKQLGCKAIPWSKRSRMECLLLVNCTPVGMHPNVDDSPLEKHHFKPRQIIFDTVYNPESTVLIKQARRQNCRVVTGIEMFIRQAALQFELMTGQAAPLDLMRDVLRRAISPVNV